MPRIRLATRASLAALILRRVLAVADLLIAQPAAPAQSTKQDDQPAVPGRSPARSRAKSKAKAKTEPHVEKPRPARPARLLHGPADRRRDVVGRGRLAVPRDARRGRAARGDARRPQDPPRARPWPTSAPGPATTASAWPGGSGPRERCWPPTSSPRCCGCFKPTPATAGVTNIKPIRATQTDTKLPEGKVDLILMVDVYHECSDPEITLQGLFKALKPTRPAGPGRVPRRRPRCPDQARAQDDPRPGPPRGRAPGLRLQGVARIPPLAARHHLREAGRSPHKPSRPAAPAERPAKPKALIRRLGSTDRESCST